MRLLPMTADARSLKTEGVAEECQSRVTRQLVDYVHGLASGNDGRALASDLELMDLYKIADVLVLRDVIDEGADYRVRYWGSTVTSVLGFDATDTLISDLKPVDMRDIVKARYDETTATGRSWVVSGKLFFVPNKDYKTFETVHLPLWDKNGAVAQIISAYDWNFEPGVAAD